MKSFADGENILVRSDVLQISLKKTKEEEKIGLMSCQQYHDLIKHTRYLVGSHNIQLMSTTLT